jgi:molybdate transport repressor ModE-like protein
MQDPVNHALGKARVSVKLVLIGSERYFGPGICELLEKIDDSGSIQAAAKQMNMSYTKAWKILNHAEETMGTELITRVSGGRNGGSSTLTRAGEDTVREFREMETMLSAYAEELMKTHGCSFDPERQGE